MSRHEILRMYVDCLFIQQAGFQRAADFTPLLQSVQEQTGIPIALEGVFNLWILTRKNGL